MFDAHLRRWRLQAAGDVLSTPSAELQPVLTASGLPAMLKRTRAVEELAGFALLQWWDGDGAAPVVARDGDVLLMVRAVGQGDLLQWSLQDDEGDAAANQVICDVLARLHAPRPAPPPLQPVARWFAALDAHGTGAGGLFAECARLAQHLLRSARQDDMVPLHGDCHHRNVLDFGQRGWLAIDPKDRCGDRGFDYALILCNPDLPHAVQPQRFARRLPQVAARAGIAPARLARWTAARAALSAVWFLEDGASGGAQHQMDMARTALHWLQQADA